MFICVYILHSLRKKFIHIDLIVFCVLFSRNITYKMAMCGVCNKSLTVKQIKVSCCDCNKDFHGTCVKCSKADIEQLTSAGLAWRCEQCSEERRSSIKFDLQATEGNVTLQDIMNAITKLSGEQKQSIVDFNYSYEQLNQQLVDNTKALQEQTEKVIKYLEIVENLTTENKKLKEKIQQLEERIDDDEQYARRNCVEIQGVPVKDNNVVGTVIHVGKALGMDIEETMIDACHTLGKRPNSQGPPGIIVKFVRRMDADLLLAKKRGKRDFSTRHLNLASDNPIYVNESLTAERRRLFALAREAKRKNNYKWIWVRGGKIFLRKEDNGPVIVITRQSDLGKI